MAYDRFLIAPIKTGLVTEIPSWQIPEDAYARLNNAYIAKGVVRKRFGTRLMRNTTSLSEIDQLSSRLRIQVDTTDGAGSASGTVPGSTFEVGQLFSIGDNIFTVSTTGTPAPLLETTSITTATFNTTTGAYNFVGADATTEVYFYPAQPVMGLAQHNGEDDTYAYDTQFVYKYSGTAWDRDGTVELNGNNSDFVWSTTWEGITADQTALFITNFNATIGTPGVSDDPMYALKGGTWAEFRPVYDVVANVVEGYVQTAKIVLPFKDRLILLNTVERTVSTNTNAEHVNRCRYSHNGSPFPAEVPYEASNAWLEGSQEWTVGGTTRRSNGAGYIDAPTEEAIEAAEFIRDRLIVYFERSTWELVYTGNQVLPFVWQKLNTELGSKSLNSPVPFDKAVFAVGQTEIHGCTGANVAKINEVVSDQVFEIRTGNNGLKRISGIREYYTDVVYWSIPTVNANINSQVFPDRVLVYNYKSDSWATIDDTITVFGYYQEQNTTTWESLNASWEQANFAWDTGPRQPKYRQVIGGNQQGFVFICDADFSTNEALMQITNIQTVGQSVRCTIIDHTLNDNDFIRIIDSGVTISGDGIYRVSVIDSDTVELLGVTLTGTYTGGGRAARVSRIDILSKQWNFYVDKGKNFFLSKIAFAVQRTSFGEVTVDYYPSSTQLSMIDKGAATGALLGDNKLQTYPFTLYPLENSQQRLWHPVYFQTEGECVQIRIYLDDDQMQDQRISAADFKLEGLIVYARPTSERLQ